MLSTIAEYGQIGRLNEEWNEKERRAEFRKFESDFTDLPPSSRPGFSSRDAESWQHCQRDTKSILAVRESGLSQSLQRDITARRKMLGAPIQRVVSVT